MHAQYNPPVRRAVAAYPTEACATRLLRGYHEMVSVSLITASQAGMPWAHTNVGASPLYQHDQVYQELFPSSACLATKHQLSLS